MVHVLNRQKLYGFDLARLKKLAGFFLDKSATSGKESFHELSLLLTDDAGIRQINRQFLDRDRVTDVISFALEPQPARREQRTAEIIINLEQADREGRQRRGREHEFALYLAHGCDHLAGHDDNTVKSRNKMRQREMRWLREALRLKLLSGLFKIHRKKLSSRVYFI